MVTPIQVSKLFWGEQAQLKLRQGGHNRRWQRAYPPDGIYHRRTSIGIDELSVYTDLKWGSSTRNLARNIVAHDIDGVAPEPIAPESHTSLGSPAASWRPNDIVGITKCTIRRWHGGKHPRKHYPNATSHPVSTTEGQFDKWKGRERTYAAYVPHGGRVEQRKSRHNADDTESWPPMNCHRTCDPKEWQPQMRD